MTLSSSPSLSKILSDVKFGVISGILLGALYCFIAVVIFVFKGSEAFDSNQTSLPKALAIYLLAGGLGGLVVGAMLRLTKWMLGAAFVGFVAAFIGWLVMGWSVNPQQPLVELLESSTVLAAAFGFPIGIGLWYQVRRYERTGKWS